MNTNMKNPLEMTLKLHLEKLITISCSWANISTKNLWSPLEVHIHMHWEDNMTIWLPDLTSPSIWSCKITWNFEYLHDKYFDQYYWCITCLGLVALEVGITVFFVFSSKNIFHFSPQIVWIWLFWSPLNRHYHLSTLISGAKKNKSI